MFLRRSAGLLDMGQAAVRDHQLARRTDAAPTELRRNGIEIGARQA
jgi:hypothetical protein